MEVKELMIGDWVKILPVKDTLKEYNTQVKQLTYDDILDSYYVEDEGNCVALKYVEPIPLTPYILAINGWIKKSYTSLFEHNDEHIPFALEIYKRDLYLDQDDTIVISCMYVHELQHALRLCGLSELAENFKI